MSATPHPSDNVPLVIDGARVTGVSRLPVINPRNGSEIWTYSGASVQDSTRAVEAAHAAFPAWSSTHPSARSVILFKAAELFLARRAELIEYMKLETAAEDAFAEFNIQATVGQLKDIARRIPAIDGYSPHMDDGNRSALVMKIPYGVILGIAPWNAPYILGTRAVAAALAAGNTVVLKGSELSPRCFYSIMNIFIDAGLPKGCLNLIYAPAEAASEVTEAVIQHPAVGKVNFTGSTAVGRIIASISGKHLKPVLLELGGKATAIVFEDADLQKAAKACLLGAFLHSGQVCMATERMVVHASVAADFAKLLKDNLASMYSSADSHPVLISPRAAEKVRGLISDALGKGANILCEARPTGDDMLAPRILSNVREDMNIFYTESFGPVATFHTFNTEDEALNIANDTEYGLAGAVFTQNLNRGLRVAKKYLTGAVHINSMSIHDEAVLSHGGMKNSGFGRFNADQGLNEFLRSQVITWEN
ncbi:hypothetical protein CDV36_015292 [Fusarium kuroshium]|uniref:Aldehyde dehydrogenase domain-containing protein n=1 Tax=Fusarium kuroshium TaxID=2010991 RepID=A0A3M2RAX3_9HYPO|nr:hypothetical protein CDV36_015292 [Fusarium kuroshium]